MRDILRNEFRNNFLWGRKNRAFGKPVSSSGNLILIPNFRQLSNRNLLVTIRARMCISVILGTDKRGHYHSALDRAIVVAIAIVIAKSLIARSGFCRRGGWLSTDWHTLCQFLSMSEWNLLGRLDSDQKTQNLQSRLNGNDENGGCHPSNNMSRGDKRALFRRALCSLPDFWP